VIVQHFTACRLFQWSRTVLLSHWQEKRREPYRWGTSSDPLRGPPSPEGKAFGCTSCYF
jgi:hypothetical protein